MKKIIKVTLIIIYYLTMFILILSDYSNIFSVSDLISNMFGFILIILLILPIVLRYKLKKSFHNIIVFCFILLFGYIITFMCIGKIIMYQYNKFSTEKWNDNKICNIRYVMINDLKSKYKLEGKSKTEIYKLLGKKKSTKCYYQEQQKDNSELCYTIDNLHERYFCLKFSKDGYVKYTYYKNLYKD